jgi:hypothetical protein
MLMATLLASPALLLTRSLGKRGAKVVVEGRSPK